MFFIIILCSKNYFLNIFIISCLSDNLIKPDHHLIWLAFWVWQQTWFVSLGFNVTQCLIWCLIHLQDVVWGFERSNHNGRAKRMHVTTNHAEVETNKSTSATTNIFIHSFLFCFVFLPRACLQTTKGSGEFFFLLVQFLKSHLFFFFFLIINILLFIP